MFYGDGLNAGLHIQHDNNTENLTAGLQKMKSDISQSSQREVDWDKSLMFISTCVGRGEDYYDGRPNVETNIVDKVFPGMSTYGFFGFGEIGFDSTSTTKYESCNFALTSVFCVINYG